MNQVSTIFLSMPRISLGVGELSLDVPAWIIYAFSFGLAFLVTYGVIPSIIKLSHEKNLFDRPDARKLHKSATPTLGGVAVFLGMVIPTMLFWARSSSHLFIYILASLLILLFVGIKDDIMEMSPKRKLAGELLAIVIVAVLGDIRVSNFHGFLGIYELPYLVSIGFTIFMYLVIINGINLIDGINGLAAGVGIVTIGSFAIWFLLIDQQFYAALSISAVGGLVAFLRFNLFSEKNRIFLGDTGSLILGLVVTIITIAFLESNITRSFGDIYISAPAIAIGVLILPLIDTLRVFILRIWAGRSPFTPDRLHIHHRLLLLNLSHMQSTMILLGINVFFIVLSVSLRYLGNIQMLMVTLPLALVLTSLPELIINYRFAISMHYRTRTGRDKLLEASVVNKYTGAKKPAPAVKLTDEEMVEEESDKVKVAI